MYTSWRFPEMAHVAFWKVEGFLGNPSWGISVQCLLSGISDLSQELLAAVLWALGISVNSTGKRQR